MERSLTQLVHLPDEILMIILQKLRNCDVLYSLIGVNKRLDTIANASIFTKNSTLTKYDDFNQFTDTMFDRFCREILPRIHHNIEWLNVESSDVERILMTDYPNLHGLGLHNLSTETARHLFTDESCFIRLCKSQIMSLVIVIHDRDEEINSITDRNQFIFTQIFNMFNNLQHLKFSSSDYQQLKFIPPPIVFSSTLLELHVSMYSNRDCLYLLDDHFNQLQTFCITIERSVYLSHTTIQSEKKLLNLKCFSLTHKWTLLYYNEFVVPLIHRMSNLEQLNLSFINYNRSIIDGNNLEVNIINRLPRLNKFTFDIRSTIHFDKFVKLPSYEDIQNTFSNFKNDQIITCLDCFPKSEAFHCHFYSYPHTLTKYIYISNNFRRGLFKHVRNISLFDERPFEHEFFLELAQSFPFIKGLVVYNWKSQKNDNQQCSIIEYPHLTKLYLVETHDNYVEQCLLNAKMCLLNNVNLHVTYDSLERVTHNFTRDLTRFNCSKIMGLHLRNKPKFYCVHLQDYFPRAEIY